jgi:hypothetical protein
MFARVRPMAGRVEKHVTGSPGVLQSTSHAPGVPQCRKPQKREEAGFAGVTVPIESGSGYSVYRAAVERDEISWQDAKAVELWR